MFPLAEIIPLLGGVGKLAKDIREAITGDLPPDKKAEIEQKLMQIEQTAQQGQLKINLAEAQSSSMFVAGWRPAIGWAGAFCIAYNAFAPLLWYILSVCGVKSMPPPTLDISQLFPIILGMLGLGGYRTYEKLKGVHQRH